MPLRWPSLQLCYFVSDTKQFFASPNEPARFSSHEGGFEDGLPGFGHALPLNAC
jgi:hypothetical protein